MSETLDAIELAHLTDIVSYRKSVQTQLDLFSERVRTYTAEVHDSNVSENSFVHFLKRKYGQETTIFEDGHIERPAPPVAPVEVVTIPPVEPAPLEAAPIDLTVEAEAPVEPMVIPFGVPVDTPVANVAPVELPNDSPATGGGS
jgi:hypothetical protein